MESSAAKGSGDERRPRHWSQHLAALVANLAPLGSGMAMGWSAPALPVLRGEEGGESLALRLTLEEASWVSAFLPLGALLGALPAGTLAQRFGRKLAMLAHALPVLLGWLLILFADKVWLLYAGRLLTGVGVGAYIVIVSLYCEEIAEVRVRGIIGSYLDMSTSSGMLLMYVLGALLPFSWFSAASLVPGAATLIFFWCMPESPAYLMGRGREDAARRSLCWLRGPTADIEEELQALRLSVKAPTTDGQSTRSYLATCCSVPKLDRATIRALIIVFGLMFFSQATGGTAFVYYTEDVFRAVNSGLAGDICMIIVGAVSVVGTFLSVLLVERVGRRFILILSSFCLSVSLLVFSVYAHFDSKGIDLTLWNWIPLACLVVFMFNISFGYGPIKYFMMAELMPTEAKGWGSSVCVCFSRIFSFAIAKEFPIMLAALGQDVTYAIFCVFSFMGSLFIILFVPETKGKTREQIQQELVKKKQNQEKVDKQEKSEC